MKKTTTIISIPEYLASNALKKLQENNITCKYMGIDQHDRILMQAEYEFENKDFIERIINRIEYAEKNINEFLAAINSDLEKLFCKK